MKTILCPTDFSTYSLKAIDYAINIALNYEAKIILFHAHHVPPRAPGVIAGSQPGMGVESLEQLRTLKSRIESEYAEKNLEIECFTRAGMPVDAIVDFADETKPDFMVMGTQGVSGLAEVIIGTVTASVIEKSSIPILAIPEKGEYKDINTISFATNFTEEDEMALDQLVHFASHFNATIDVLHIMEEGASLTDDQIAQLKAFYIKRFDYEKLSFHIESNLDVIEGIYNHLDNHPVDVLAMVTEKRNFFQKIFRTSYTLEMVSYGEVPILAFHE